MRDSAVAVASITGTVVLVLAFTWSVVTDWKAEAAERMALIERGCVPEFVGGGCGKDYTRWHCGDGGTP